MKSKFCLDCEGLTKRERSALCRALGTVAVSDIPLLLELVFVSKEEIRALNARERKVDAVTDVLSFPANELTAGDPIVAAEHATGVEPPMEEGRRRKRNSRLFLGSVVICKERAKEQAEEYGHSYERELCYLAVHGALHCLGYDHEREEEKAVMREKEEYVMKKLGLERRS